MVMQTKGIFYYHLFFQRALRFLVLILTYENIYGSMKATHAPTAHDLE